MANWTVSDELDSRLRERLGVGDIAGYVEGLITDQLNYDDDPAYRAKLDEQITASLADIEAGRVTDARDAMRAIAKDKNIKLDR